MGKQYTKEELELIQRLTEKELTRSQIAHKLGRTEAGIRNIRHRSKLKANTKKSLQTLIQNEKKLSKRISHLQIEIAILKKKLEGVRKVLQTEEETLNTKLQTVLYKLKDQKPELFQITIQEQIGKLAGELTTSFIK